MDAGGLGRADDHLQHRKSATARGVPREVNFGGTSMTMFENNNGGGDDRQDGPAVPIPTIPPLRTYRVVRFNPETDQPEELTILANDSAVNGEVLTFVRLVLDPVEGPRAVVVKRFNGWDTYE